MGKKANYFSSPTWLPQHDNLNYFKSPHGFPNMASPTWLPQHDNLNYFNSPHGFPNMASPTWLDLFNFAVSSRSSFCELESTKFLNV